MPIYFIYFSVSSRLVSAVLSSQVSVDDAAATLSQHPAVLEFNLDMEDMEDTVNQGGGGGGEYLGGGGGEDI